MGGIGKLTLAKALSSHISYKFDATCFIDDLKVCSLQERQDILKHTQKTKKILIVVDDVKNMSQFNILLDIDLFKDDDGSKLITTSCT
uniref:NB-ARC domain-containing protein n=1 Tax=Physcomitrium patens TaxID=3218 RepID=A0A2K1JXN0_PHYPA|nr:hypothetical protein PHYPA_013399 [Physcomitrium patens]